MVKLLATAGVLLSIVLMASVAGAQCGLDVNGDDKIGLEEVIFSLQVVAGMTPSPIPLCADRAAEYAIKNAYTAAQAYFTDEPEACISYQNLIDTGFVNEKDIQVAVIQCSQNDLLISTQHPGGEMIFYINAKGEITSTEKDR